MKIGVIFLLLAECHSLAIDKKLSLKITADVLTLLTGNFFDIPIDYLEDIGNQLNKLDQVLKDESRCHNRRISNAGQTTIRHLQNFAECLVDVTKYSNTDLPVSVNSILETITDLLDPDLLTVRYMKIILQNNFQTQCEVLIHDIEEFTKTDQECLQSHTIHECVKRDGSDNLREALNCII
uniref:Secreted protein n=1 Tax=Photinus pyralis TaxID=7054 RepID=A0A1Y1LDF7_PHOPY